jgi:eukaryotic-like serine/threonine-protein kinase
VVDPHDKTLPASPSSDPPTANVRGIASGILSRIAGVSPGDSFGRYTVLEAIGRGGMGEVFKAYDPELDRVVALKLLRPEIVEQSSYARARFGREAQAMGRLNHPNVVAVYDVGTEDDRVFVAMELVDGPNLSAWLAAHPRARPRELVELFLQAGRGLAAAHDAGIVHRDFKPSNVIVGDRVRVADFGLARLVQEPFGEATSDAAGSQDATVTQTGQLVGTPAYMAPEQHAGGAPSALSDQYSFGVALHEGLYGTRPGAPRPADRRAVPSWIARVVERALQPRPEARYPAMRELLAALGRDPGRARRQAAWAIGAAVVVGSVIVAGRDTAPRCEGAEAQVAALWSAPARVQVAAAFRATGVAYADATFAKVDDGLARWQVAWSREHRAACEATHVRHEQSEALLDRRMQCLTRAKAEVVALVGLLGHADRSALDRATQAAGDIGAPAACADATALSPVAPPRDPVVRAEVEAVREGLSQLAAQRKLGQWQAGLVLGHALIDRARHAGYAPVLGQVLVAEASLELTADGDIPAAIERSYEAAELGAASNDDAVVAGAFNNVSFALGSKKQQFDAAEVAYRAAKAAIARMGNPPRYLADLELYRGYALDRQGDFAGALALRKQLLVRYTEIYGPDSYQVAAGIGQVASALSKLGRAVEARPLFMQALALAERAIGPMHPNFGVLLQNAGGSVRETGDIATAAGLLERAVAVEEARGVPNTPPLAHALETLAAVRYEQRRLDDARALLERAIAMRIAKLGPTAPQVAEGYATLGEVALLQGDAAEAHRLHQQALAIERKALGDHHPHVGGSYREDAAALTVLGRYAEAHAAIDRALAIDQQTIGDDHPDHGDTLMTQGDLLCAEQHCGAAVELYRRAVALHEKEVGAESTVLVEPMVGLCAALLAAGDHAAARTTAERAVRIAAQAPGDLRGEAQLCLARAEWAGGDHDAARGHARDARTSFAALTFPARGRPLVEHWLAAHP